MICHYIGGKPLISSHYGGKARDDAFGLNIHMNIQPVYDDSDINYILYLLTSLPGAW